MTNRICISVQAGTVNDLVDAIAEASQAAVWVEVRADFLRERVQEEHLKLMRKSATGKVVFTCRSRDEGGVFPGTEPERIALLGSVVSAGFDLVDVEYHTFTHMKVAIPSGQLLLSHHDFSRTPPLADLQQLLEAMEIYQPAVRKIATMVNEVNDLAVLLQLMAERYENTIIIGMGEKGKITRVLGPVFGALFSYTGLREGSGTASGQYSYEGLVQVSKSLGLTEFIS